MRLAFYDWGFELQSLVDLQTPTWMLSENISLQSFKRTLTTTFWLDATSLKFSFWVFLDLLNVVCELFTSSEK